MAERGRAAPPMAFDGRFHWYTEWFDPADDRCCLCRGPIAEEDVPLILFKQVGRATWQARFCDLCTGVVLSFMTKRA